jgi:serine phosphatase RsbU (regulator of sigma subunit)
MTSHHYSPKMRISGFYILSIASILLVLAVLLVSTGLFVLYSVKSKHFTEVTVQKQIEHAHHVAQELNNYLKNSHQLVQTTTSVLQPLIGDLPQTETMLQRILDSAPSNTVYGIGAWFEPSQFTNGIQYIGPYAKRERHTLKSEITHEWMTPEYDYLKQYWYLQVKHARGQLTVTEPYFDTFTIFITLGNALLNHQHEVIGAITLDMELSMLSEVIKRINSHPTEVIYVTTDQNKLFLHPHASELLHFAQEQDSKIKTILDINPQRLADFHRHNGLENTIDSVAIVELSGWKVHISSDRSHLLKEVTHLRNSILSTVAILWLITAILLIILRRAALRTQKAAAETARLEQQIIEREHKQQLLQEMNSELEIRVRARTSDLSKANAEIECLLRKLEKDNSRMSAELNITRQLQQMILPRAAELLQFSKLDIAGFMEPASEVGGDYYDVLDCNGHTVIGIGDVTGHGLASGVLMLMVQTAVRALTLNHNCRLEECLGTLNRTIYENVQRMDTDKNLTLTLLDYNEGKLVVSGQHEEVLVMRQHGEIERIDTLDLGFMIGIEPDITQFIARHEITLQPGDGIVLYTDGITEAKNVQDEMYGVERLCQVLQQHRHLTAKELQQAVIADVKAHLGINEVADDITLLVLKRR